MFRLKRKNDKIKSVTLRFQGKDYTLMEGYFFKPFFTVSLEGDLIGHLKVNKDLSIEVVSID